MLAVMGVGMGTTCAVTGGVGDSMRQTVQEWVGDGDKDTFCGGGVVMGSSTCHSVILYIAVSMTYHLHSLLCTGWCIKT